MNIENNKIEQIYNKKITQKVIAVEKQLILKELHKNREIGREKSGKPS